MAIVAAAGHYLLHVRLTIEDAGITYSYARTFAEGFGLGHIFENAPKAEGYSNFLWLMLLAPLGRLTTMEIASKILGFVFAVGAVVVVHRTLWSLARDRRILWGAAVAGLIAPTAMWAAAGLENSLYVFLIVLSAMLVVEEEKGGRRFPWSACALVFVAVTRPEGFVYAGAAGACKLLGLWRRRHDRDRVIVDVAVWAVVVLVGIGGYLAWHYAFYRDLLPTTVIAKSVTPSMKGDVGGIFDLHSAGWRYTTEFFRQDGGLFVLPLALLGAAVAVRSRAAVVVAFALASLALPLYSPDWMPHLRFFFAFPTLLVVLALLGTDAVFAHVRRLWSTRAFPACVALSALPVLALGLFAFTNMRQSKQIHDAGYPHFLTMDYANNSYENLQATASELGLADPFTIIPDVGGSTYLGRMRVIDSLGLADVQVAHSNWDRALLEQYFFVERRPELVTTHEPWTSLTGITSMPLLRSDYVAFPDPGHEQFVRRDALVTKELPGDPGPGLMEGDALAAWSGPDSAMPASAYALDLYWSAASRPAPSAIFDVSLFDETGTVVRRAGGTVGHPWLPMSTLAPDEVLRRRVVLPMPVRRGIYRLEVAFRSDDQAVRVVARRPLQVDVAAAAAEARKRAARAVEVARDGAVDDALKELRVAAVAAASHPHSLAAIHDRRRTITRIAFAAAEAEWQDRDRDELLEAVRVATQARGRMRMTVAERQFAAALRAGAVEAGRGGDHQGKYELLSAAAATDPSDSVVQHRLEHARRVHLRRR